jgi:single-strand DNA-binding protein
VNDTMVTVVGNVVDSPRRVSLDQGAVTNFRMAATARRFDSRTNEFIDAGTFWVDVECWNGLSGNVSASVSKGDPVIVRGALTTHSWESENGRRSTPRIRAFAVGPNLARGTAVFKRDKVVRAGDPAEADAGATLTTAASGPLSPSGNGADEEFPGSVEELMSGRDYVGDDTSVDQADADEISPVPAHA